jgi:2-C-methyl-D-erythritol 4-phosphate cytidylyltransferase
MNNNKTDQASGCILTSAPQDDARTVEGSTPAIHALIVAAGKGSRFGSELPKQYIKLGQRTLLQHSVARLASSPQINDCLIVIAADDELAKQLDYAMPVHFAIGGAERWQSVQAGVQALLAAGGQADDLVMIHDAARPAVPTQDIAAVIAAASKETYGAILASPVTDTLKAEETTSTGENSEAYISHTVSRAGLWQAQTPQVFRLAALQEVLAYVAAHDLAITDEASAFEALSLPIKLVAGSRENIKLTYPEDDNLLAAILAMRADK